MSSESSLREVLKARARARERIIKDLASYARELRENLGRVSVILFGSLARGDHNLWSDIDVIIISERFRGIRFVERCLSLRDPFGNLSPICWTPGEFERMIDKSAWREALRESIIILDMHGVRRKLLALGIRPQTI